MDEMKAKAEFKEVKKLKIDFATVMKSLDGKEMTKAEDGKPLTLRDVAVSAVVQPIHETPLAEKAYRWGKGKKYFNATESLDLDENERDWLVTEIAKRHNVVVTGAAMDILGGPSPMSLKEIKA